MNRISLGDAEDTAPKPSAPLCSCGRAILGVPHKHRVQRSNDVFAGIYFECECGSTIFVPEPKPKSESDPEARAA